MSLGELTINDSILRAYSKQRASESFRCLSFSSSRRRSSALPPRRANPCIGILSLVFAVGVFHYKMWGFRLKWSERADKEFLFLCCSHLSILIGKLINICTSGCQLLTVKFCYKAHFINTKDALSTILLNKHLQIRSSFIISYNYRRFWKQFAVCAFGSRFLGSCVLLLGAGRDTTNDKNG